jgi:glycerophosphoryl diester phosphodiesterase
MTRSPRLPLAALLVSLLVAPVSLAVEVIAHRGASYDAPENTVAALKLGFEQGADSGELDLHLSRDGKIVIIHDPDTKRTAGVDRKVVEQTFDELRRLDVGRFGDWAGKGFNERVPTLDECLALVPKGKKMFIEIKCKEEALPPLEAALRKSKLAPDQTVIITFHHDVAAAAKKRFPDRQVYWLHSYNKDKQTGQYPDLGELIRKAKEAGVDGLNLNHNFPLDAANVQKIKSAGLKCYTWTVDDPDKARQLAAAGVDGITTNRPAFIREQLKAGSNPAVAR